MKKIIFLFTLFFCLFIFKTNVSAKDFNVTFISEYKVNDNGKTNVTDKITIKNLEETLYAKKYILKLDSSHPTDISAFESGKRLNVFTSLENGIFNIIVEFDSPLIGKGSSRSFLINYTDETTSSKIGEIWNINIPKIINPDMFDFYKLNLSVPKSFGKEAYIIPDPRERQGTNERIFYTFFKDDLIKHGISASFGKYQVFSFKTRYILKNLKSKKEIQKIAIPPDTSTQKIYLMEINPKPNNIELDNDGNWLASFQINPKSIIGVTVKGYVQIFAIPRSLFIQSPRNLLENLKEIEYWDYSQDNIRNVANNLYTIDDVYNFVTNTLVYDYNRIKPDETRFGASKALKNPKNSICREYTDLFIALSRKKGIPTREVVGFAYSENPKIQSLSLISDVFHSWVEYWNSEKNVWIPVDPTWGSVTNKDYLNKFDLNHFALVLHGKSSTYPLATNSYPKKDEGKDVEVDIDKLPEFENPNIDISYEGVKSLNILNKKIKISLKNNGKYAIYNSQYQIYFDNNISTSEYIPVIPPFSNIKKEISIPIGIFAIKSPNYILIKAYRSEYIIENLKNHLIISQLLLFFFIFILLILAFYFITHKKTLLLKIKLLKLFIFKK